ncbi:MAG: hypothetical protein AB7V25_15720 [Mangrovibacterium sp.]
MKRAAIYFVLFVLFISCTSSQYMTGRGRYDISDNLDLEAIAYLFGESEDLRDFEYRLNDPELGISNLDLNRDGYIDYLRVEDASWRGNYLVVIQAVLGRNSYQDVATISIGRDSRGMPIVEVSGDDYLYGPDYVFVPAYVHRPLIIEFFWGPRYESWHSPYHWGYYPSWYAYRRPWPVYRYHEHIHRHHYAPSSFHYSGERRISVPGHSRRNDYGARRPEHSFIHRNQGFQNKEDLNNRRSDIPDARRRSQEIRRPGDQPARDSQTGPSPRRSALPVNRETSPRKDEAPLRERPASPGVKRSPSEERTTPSENRRISPERQRTPGETMQNSEREKGQRVSPASPQSNRRSGSSSVQRSRPANGNQKSTAAPSVRTESSSRRQSVTHTSKETKHQSSKKSEQAKSRSGRR